LGKTNMHELAFGITSNNAAFGAVHNPYDIAMIPGGSSGGTAAAIAARMCPAGLGTDTGGSVRIPAALCGIVGLRTTAGRYSLRGVVPLSHTRDTVGPMARSIADLVLLDDVITRDAAPVRPAKLQGLRLGVPRKYFYENLDAELESARPKGSLWLAFANPGAVGQHHRSAAMLIRLLGFLRSVESYGEWMK
jgi:mandelamide amidase